MGGIVTFTEHLFWSIVWIFLILIIGFWLLGLLSGRFDGLGNVADWIATRARGGR